MQQRDWNQEWCSGRWDFLGGASERARLHATAKLIARHGPGPLVDLGSGDGVLLRHLNPTRTPEYLGVDLSSAALARIRDHPGIRVEMLNADLAAYRPTLRAAAAIACGEILYYLADPAAVLTRWAAACRGLRAVVVSIAEPGERFPGWAAPVARARAAVDGLGWPLLETHVIQAQGQRWTVSAYGPEPWHE